MTRGRRINDGRVCFECAIGRDLEAKNAFKQNYRSTTKVSDSCLFYQRTADSSFTIDSSSSSTHVLVDLCQFACSQVTEPVAHMHGQGAYNEHEGAALQCIRQNFHYLAAVARIAFERGFVVSLVWLLGEDELATFVQALPLVVNGSWSNVARHEIIATASDSRLEQHFGWLSTAWMQSTEDSPLGQNYHARRMRRP